MEECFAGKNVERESKTIRFDDISRALPEEPKLWELWYTHRPLSSSFLWFIFRIL